MNLYKRNQMWWVKYQVDGVVYRKSTHTRNKKIAQEWVDKISIAKKMPTFEDAVDVLRTLFRNDVVSGTSLETAWESYINLAKAIGKLPDGNFTVTNRKATLGHFIEWVKSNAATVKTIEGVTGAIAAQYAKELAKSGRKTKTRKNIIGDLSAVWTVLEKSSPRIRNPWKNLSPKVTDAKRLPAFTPEQEERVLAAAKKVGKDWYPVCVIARHTGLRYGSVANLRWDEVDMKDGVIRHKPEKTIRFDIAVELPIIKPIKDAITSLKRRGDFLFPLHAHLYGKRGRKNYAILNFKEVLDTAGISGDYTFHSWRHTAATRLAAAGADIETRKKILGHTQDQTAERYDHDSHLGEIRKAMEAAAK